MVTALITDIQVGQTFKTHYFTKKSNRRYNQTFKQRF